MPYLRDATLNARRCFRLLHVLWQACYSPSFPIARGSLSDMMDGLKEGTRGTCRNELADDSDPVLWSSRSHLAMVLMVSAGLLGKSLYQLLHLDMGFNPHHLVYFQTSWAPGKYDTDQQLAGLTSV